MARSTTNKAKGAAKKSAPRAPKASINARAKLTAITTAAGEAQGYGNPTGTAMVITLKIPMGAPATVPSWESFKSNRGGWQRSDFIRSGLNKLKPAKTPKAKKGEPETVADAVGKTLGEAAETKRLGQEFDAQLKVKYDAECTKADNANARFMQRAAAFAMFAALRGQEVQISLTPVQQGFSAMFGTNGAQAQLGAGEPADEPNFDDNDDLTGDRYGDDE